MDELKNVVDGHASGVVAGPADAGEPEAEGVLPADLVAGTLVLRVGYRGAGFSGYAEQPGQRTVAGELRRALETMLRREVDMTCAGRTDAGVNALSQYVSVPVTAGELERSGRRTTASLVALTPDDLSIRGIYRGGPSFSARFDATERAYRYRIACGPARPVMAWGHSWWLRTAANLDVDAMAEASRCLLGEHDFRSFCKASSAQLLESDGRSTCRCLTAVDVTRVREAGEDLVAVDVRGNAFLHNMVRIIVGSLVEVGRGHRDAAWLKHALEARSRQAAGPTAPAEGLTFEDVTYLAGALEPWE